MAADLAKRGHRVGRLVRPQTPRMSGETLAWDTGAVDAAGLEGVGAVIHLAGAGIGDRRWSASRKREIVRSRTGGTGQLARTLAELTRSPAVRSS